MNKLCVAVLAIGGISTSALADGRLSGRVTDHSGQPIGDTSVFITSSDGLQTRAITDPTGYYATVARGNGPYAVLFAFGGAHADGRVDVPAGGAATLDTQLALGGEIIEVQGRHEPAQFAQLKSDPLLIPPYSDKAALGNHWERAWLLLDIDDHGVVSRAKFLKRPGYDLDEIAVQHVFGLRFDPARDSRGVPTKSYVVWPLEWPSMTWMQSRGFLMNRLPVFPNILQGAAGGVLVDSYPPCEGSGPLNLTEVNPMYRDCSEPNLAVANAAEPWLVRDGRTPPPVVADAPIINLAQARAERIADARDHRNAAYVTTALTGAMLAGSAAAYVQYRKYDDRASRDRGAQLTADKDSANKWELGMVALAAGALVTGITSAHLWMNASIAVAPVGEAGGGSVSVAGRF